MALIVQKYGGTSVGSIERMHIVTQNILRAKEQGHQIVVVVSAMAGETDRLIELTASLQSAPCPREYSTLVATGEQVSTALLSMILQAYGVQSRSYTGGQVRILTDSVLDKARILEVETHNLQRDIAAGCIPIIAGFQGVDEAGNITTLGRGGSDTTAVAVAAALKADECQIYTDVDGVYTTDPHVVPQASRLDKITFEEMLELSSLGAKVLQIRAVELAGKYKLPLRVLSSFTEGPGTLITYDQGITMEQPIISGIAFNRNEAKLTLVGVSDMPGVASQIISPISAANIEIDMIIQNASVEGKIDFTFTVHRDNYAHARDILEQVARELGAEDIRSDNKIAKLSLVGVGMRNHSGIAAKMFETLAREGINIQLITTSEIKVSVVLDEKYIELGIRALHSAFGLDKEPEEEFDPKTKKF